MDQKLWQKVEDLFHAALECPPEARHTFLDEACQGDADLRREIVFLLEKEAERLGASSKRRRFRT